MSRPSALALDDQELARLEALATDLTHNIPYCPWTPNPGPQTMFLLDFGREALYGGAAGGGKSIALLMSASQFLHVPGYSALLLRKSFPDLNKPGALMDIAEQWWGGVEGVKFEAQERTYVFDCPDGGQSKIVFGSLDTQRDRFKYQGGAYNFVGYDELTQFLLRDYTYLFSRIRRVKDPTNPLSLVPPRMRTTTNPGGTGHEWVHQRFIAGWERWKDGRGTRPTRNFHPAIISDNPMLDRADYEQSLMELDPVTRAQLMRGDWKIRPDGRMFKRSWFKVVPLSQVPRNCTWVRFWDMASTEADILKVQDNGPDYTAGALVGRSPRGQYYIADMRHWRHEPAENDLMCKATAYYDTRRVQQRMEQEPGAGGKTMIHHFRTQVFDGFTFTGAPAVNKGSKTVAAGPVASQADAGNVYIVEEGWNDAFLSEIEMFPDSAHDDQVDAVSGAFSYLAKVFNLGLMMGQHNEQFETEDSGWKPDSTPQFEYGDITASDGMFGRAVRMGKGKKGESMDDVREEAARIQAAQVIRAAFDV